MTGIAEYDAYLAKWREEKHAAESRPLAAGLTLIASGLAALSHPYGTLLESQPSEHGLPLALTFRQAPNIQSTGLTHAEFRLLYPLRSGPGHWAQVWVTAFKRHNSEEELHMVIKLFQEALFPFPELSAFKGSQPWRASMQCSKEAWAFARLKALQGSLLPHSYGFYDFGLPCGQTVCGHVMELIDGVPLERDFRSMLDGSWYSDESRQRRRILLEHLALSVHTLHTHGVHHGDLIRGNVLQLRKDPTSFVFLDFARSSPTESVKSDVLSDDVGLFGCLQEVEDCTVVLDWLEHNIMLKAAWTEPFDVRYILDGWREDCASSEQMYVDEVQRLRRRGEERRRDVKRMTLKPGVAGES